MDVSTLNLFPIGTYTALPLMAAPAEYGRELQKRIKPVFIGVGPVEAAINATAILGRLAQDGALPDLVISLGSAGSATLDHCGVYQVQTVAYRDMDASPLGIKKGVTPFVDEPAHMPLPLRVEGLPKARLATGASVVSGAAYDTIDADMVDMETFAIWRVCQMYNVPLLGLRGISDGKSELSKYEDWTEYLGHLDEKLAVILDGLAGTLRGI